ncbi:hypothetical protein Ancab_020211 [Ancistrocladus abbreviatus]
MLHAQRDPLSSSSRVDGEAFIGFSPLNTSKAANLGLESSLKGETRDKFKEYTSDNQWPPRHYTCSFCRREFKSVVALGGHMNVHRRDRASIQASREEKEQELVGEDVACSTVDGEAFIGFSPLKTSKAANLGLESSLKGETREELDLEL